MNDLLTKVKQNLILEHSADDTLLQFLYYRCRFLCRELSAHPENYYAENHHACDHRASGHYACLSLL